MSASNKYSDLCASQAEAPVDTGTPEQRLFVAIIERGIYDYYKLKKYGLPNWKNKSGELIRLYELEEWLFENNFVDPDPFSLPWLLIGISARPEEVHEKILSFIESPTFGQTMGAKKSRNYVIRLSQILLH